MGISRYLTYAGRLILVNSVYSAIPTFYMCTLKLSIEILDQVDSNRKHVLCHGGDLSKKGGYLVAWNTACTSKEEGGLGIIDLKAQNSALLLNFLHKFYNNLDLSWVQLTWKCLYRNGTPTSCQERSGLFLVERYHVPIREFLHGCFLHGSQRKLCSFFRMASGFGCS